MKQTIFALFLMILLAVESVYLHAQEDQMVTLFKRNELMYEVAFYSDEPLSELSKLHLLALRVLIDVRLEDFNLAYRDSDEIYEMTQNDEYLQQEFMRKYK